MPQDCPFHKTNPLALHSVGDDAGWLTSLIWCFSERALDLLKVMPVDLANRPAETGELCRQRLQLQSFIYRSETLDLVVIHNVDQIVELVMGGKQYRFPI